MTTGTAKRLPESRLRVLEVLVVALVLFLTGRLWQLQVVRGGHYAALADGNRIRLIATPAPRGTIYDRNGKPLASNRMAFIISVIPRDMKNPDEVIPLLAKITGIDAGEIKAKIEEKTTGKYRRPFEPVRLVVDAGPDLVAKIEERRFELSGVMVEEVPVRYYPGGSLAAHVLGYIGEISKEELASLGEKGYRGGDIIGKVGIEKALEDQLRGIAGGQQVEVNSAYRPTRVLGSKEPVPGADVVLTIDAKVQAAAEKALADQIAAIKEKGEYPNVSGGSVVAISPKTGEILAMASYPTFNPGDFVGGLSPETWAYLSSAARPLTNRAVSGEYAPGSTFKAIVAIAALAEGKVTPSEKFVCSRSASSKYYGKKCWVWALGRTHGVLDLAGALANSCNIVFYELGRRLGPDLIAKYARMFGLGSPTGLQFFPTERPGLVPDSMYKASRFTGYNRTWYDAETLDYAIGQGFLTVTPLQMANVYAAIASRGHIHQPTLIKRIETPGGERDWEPEHKETGFIKLDDQVWDEAINGLTQVVTRGTAAGAFWGFPIPTAGKSGSAQPPKGDTNGWFAAFAPVDDPQIVVLAMVEHGGGGASAAAPIVRKVLEAYFGIQGPGATTKANPDEAGIRAAGAGAASPPPVQGVPGDKPLATQVSGRSVQE